MRRSGERSTGTVRWHSTGSLTYLLAICYLFCYTVTGYVALRAVQTHTCDHMIFMLVQVSLRHCCSLLVRLQLLSVVRTVRIDSCSPRSEWRDFVVVGSVDQRGQSGQVTFGMGFLTIISELKCQKIYLAFVYCTDLFGVGQFHAPNTYCASRP